MGYDNWNGETEVITFSKITRDGITSKSKASFKGENRFDEKLASEMGSRIAEGHTVAHTNYFSNAGNFGNYDSGSGIGDVMQTGSALIGIAKCLLPFI